VDYPHTRAATREIHQHPSVRATTKLRHIREHYFRSHTSINPFGILPTGPRLDYDRPHHREHLGGQSLADLTSENA